MKLWITGFCFIITGLVVPWGIDCYETANSLDISRDIGSLPWIILMAAGVILIVLALTGKRDRNMRTRGGN